MAPLIPLCVEQSTLVCAVFVDFACHSYQHNILEVFLYLVLTFLVIALATTVSSLVNEGVTLGNLVVLWHVRAMSCSKARSSQTTLAIRV